MVQGEGEGKGGGQIFWLTNFESLQVRNTDYQHKRK